MQDFEQKNKRERIMRAGIVLFMEQGFHKTKMEDIAQKAAVGKGTLYAYFDSKKDLFMAIADWGFVGLLALIEEKTAKKMGLEKKLQVVLITYLEVIWKHNNFITMLESEINVDHEIKAKFKGLGQKFELTIANILREEPGLQQKDIGFLASLFIGLGGGLVHKMLFSAKEEKPDFEAWAQKAVRVYLYGALE